MLRREGIAPSRQPMHTPAKRYRFSSRTPVSGSESCRSARNSLRVDSASPLPNRRPLSRLNGGIGFGPQDVSRLEILFGHLANRSDVGGVCRIKKCQLG